MPTLGDEHRHAGALGQLAIVLMSFSAVLEVLRGNLDAAESSTPPSPLSLWGAGIPAGADFHVLSAVCSGWHRGSIAPIADDLAAIYARAPWMVAWTQVIALLDTAASTRHVRLPRVTRRSAGTTTGPEPGLSCPRTDSPRHGRRSEQLGTTSSSRGPARSPD